MHKRFWTFLMLAVFAFMAVGCCPVTKLSLTVQLDDALRQKLADAGNRQMQVDIVGISPSERQRWTDYSMTKYWTADDALRASVKDSRVTLTFDPRDNKPQAVPASDPHWTQWMAGANDKDAPRLFILAQLPGTWSSSDDKQGNEDVRRLILPLGSCRWNSTNVTVTVTSTGITTNPSPKLDKGS